MKIKKTTFTTLSILLSVLLFLCTACSFSKPTLYSASVSESVFQPNDGRFEKDFDVVTAIGLFTDRTCSAQKGDFIAISYSTDNFTIDSHGNRIPTDEFEIAKKVAEEYAEKGVVVMLYKHVAAVGGVSISGTVYTLEKDEIKTTNISSKADGKRWEDISAKLRKFA